MLTKNVNELRFIVLDGGSYLVHENILDGDFLNIGTHYISWDGRNNMDKLLSSGIYYGFLEIDGNVEHRIKMAIFNK